MLYSHALIWPRAQRTGSPWRRDREEGGYVVVIGLLYTLIALALAVYGINALMLVGLYLWRRPTDPPPPPPPETWPRVTVQIPLYNEVYVADRVIRAVARLDYPRDRLEIQVLDDSDDETSEVIATLVARLRRQGVHIVHVRRDARAGYKAGALAYGLARATGEFVAVFDADFVPPRDWLKRTLPYLTANPRLGFVQTRWEHLNAHASAITLAQTLALDGHFAVEQAARQAIGWPLTFNGSAGLWRRECIEQSGNWQGDTLCEDLDLAYRAQLAGWQGLILVDVAVPGEVPPVVSAFRQQQARWAMGSVQTLRKLGARLLRASHLSWPARWQGLIHLSNYFVHPLLLLLLVLTPLVLMTHPPMSAVLTYLGLSGLGPPLVYMVAQWRLRRSPRRLLALPVLVALGLGIAWTSTRAIVAALRGRPAPFLRTPKFRCVGRTNRWHDKKYGHGTWQLPTGELLWGLYALLVGMWAWYHGHGYALAFLLLYALSFGFVALTILYQQHRHVPTQPVSRPRWRSTLSRRREQVPS